MKKVIFIGGVSYSGTTLLDMILSNSISGFSCGELSSLFYPHKDHHINQKCGCGNAKCRIWNEVLYRGERKIYETLFSMFPDIDFIVDSSKDPMWIRKQIDILSEANIQTKNVLIYKTPIESAYSFQKRNRFNLFEPSWINYHRLYFTLINDFLTVKYSDLVTNFKTLSIICKFFEIPYFDNKKEYWNKNHHTLFGNNSAKMHLESKVDDAVFAYKDRFNNSSRNKYSIKKEFKKIYYEKVSDTELRIKIDNMLKNNYKLKNIYDLLIKKQLTSQFANETKETDDDLINGLKFSRIQLKFRRFKRIYIVNRLKCKTLIKNSRKLNYLHSLRNSNIR